MFSPGPMIKPSPCAADVSATAVVLSFKVVDEAMYDLMIAILAVGGGSLIILHKRETHKKQNNIENIY